jgi:hypothetical protein
MNWGTWIALSFVLFALFIGALVVVCVRQDVSLVAPDYYKQEIDYQKQIERIQNAEQLLDKPEISIHKNFIQVDFIHFDQIEKCELKLFRPSNPKSDHVFHLQPSSATVQRFDVSHQQPGMYKVKLTWSMNETEFYLEKSIYL